MLMKTETTHTPGLWRISYGVSDGKTYVLAGPDTMPFTGQIIAAETTDPNTQANLRLIAAAPCLLEALEQCLRALTDETGNEAEREYDASVKARAAIAKARGQQ